MIKVMAEKGNPNSVSDAGVGALCARTAVSGAFLNVKINVSGFNDKAYVKTTLAAAGALELKAIEMEKIIMDTVNVKINV